MDDIEVMSQEATSDVTCTINTLTIHSYAVSTWHARRNVSYICWTYFMCPCAKEPIEGIWKEKLV